jgi:hypothetical protein
MRKLRVDYWKDEGNWLELHAGGEIEQLLRIIERTSGWKNLSQPRLGARIWRWNCEAMAKAIEKGVEVVPIRFEDIIKDTEKELKKVCKKIGIIYKNEMLKFHRDEANQGRVLAGGTRADRKLDTSRGEPEILLDNEEKQVVLEESMPWAEKLGYA